MNTLSQTKQRGIYRTLSLVLLAAFGVLFILARVMHLDVHWLAITVALAAVAFSLMQFFVLDEAAKQAHYIAWYWGGLVGLVALMAVGLAFATDVAPFEMVVNATTAMMGAADERELFLFGLLAGPSAMFLGFIVWWSAHWVVLRQGSGK